MLSAALDRAIKMTLILSSVFCVDCQVSTSFSKAWLCAIVLTKAC